MFALRVAAVAVTFSVLAPGEADAKPREKIPVDYASDNFTPMGAILELMPAASLCLPTAAAQCKNPEWGRTGLMAGGQFSAGYRPLRHIAIGGSYVGAAVTLDWDVTESASIPMERQFNGFGQIHAGYLFARPTIGYQRVDFAFEVGGGFSWAKFPGSGPNGFTQMYSRGFSMLLGPTLDVFLARHFYLGVKANFILNVQTRVCIEDADGKRCRRRNKDDDQLPIHQILPGIHLGFVM